MVGIRSPIGLVVGSCTSHPGVLGLAPATLVFWARIPNERNQEHQAHPVLRYRVPHGSHRAGHSSTPNVCSLSHSPSAPPPSFTQSPYPPRSLVRDEQTHPHRPRLVVSHSTCPPLSSPPHANSFVIGPAVIKHTHPKHPTGCIRPGLSRSPAAQVLYCLRSSPTLASP